MTTNPYQSPGDDRDGHRGSLAVARSTRTRMGVVLGNAVLLGLFPPFCCPCGFGPLGFLLQPYMMLLGAPAIALPVVFPELIHSGRLLFLSLYVVNYVLMSYLMGVVVERLRARRRSTVKEVGFAGGSDTSNDSPRDV